MNEQKVIIEVTCIKCFKTYKIEVFQSDWEKFKNGEGHIQNLFSYIPYQTRELFISKICPDCWNKIFGSEE